MRWKAERKVLWTVIGILVVINVLALVLFASQRTNILPSLGSSDTNGDVTYVSNADTIESVSQKAIPSVVYIVAASGSGPNASLSQGSGAIISSDGLIVTNYHVIEDAKNISIRLYNKEIYNPQIVGIDEETDLAVLRINAHDLTPFKFGDSERVEIGEPVIAIGSPFGYDFTVTSGIISGKNRDDGPTEYRDYLQTDASINPGNSGGPLINMDGELIGIATFIVSRERTGELGFAIPSNMVKVIVDRLVMNGTVERGYFGVMISDPREIDENGNGRIPNGARIVEVSPDSPAANGGLKVNDTVVEIDGMKVIDSNQLRNYIAFVPPGTVVDVLVMRENRTIPLAVIVGTRPKNLEVENKTEK